MAVAATAASAEAVVVAGERKRKGRLAFPRPRFLESMTGMMGMSWRRPCIRTCTSLWQSRYQSSVIGSVRFGSAVFSPCHDAAQHRLHVIVVVKDLFIRERGRARFKHTFLSLVLVILLMESFALYPPPSPPCLHDPRSLRGVEVSVVMVRHSTRRPLYKLHAVRENNSK